MKRRARDVASTLAASNFCGSVSLMYTYLCVRRKVARKLVGTSDAVGAVFVGVLVWVWVTS